MSSKKTFLRLVLIALAIILLGSTLIAISEKTSFAEAVYRSVYVALSHHDSFHMDTLGGRAATLGIIIASLLVLGYLLKILADYMISLGDGLKRNKMKAKLINMSDHYIVCGLGRVGSHIATELAAEGVKFVGIDRDESVVKAAVAAGHTAFVADGTNDSVLEKAKIGKAKGIVAALGDDSSNLFLTLTARQLNPSLFIVARVNREENIKRVEKAGADKVAMPNQIGGFHMATMLVRPGVLDFFDVLNTKDRKDLQVEELIVDKKSKILGHRLHHVLGAAQSGSMVLALNTIEGKSLVNPTGQEILHAGDKLILMGTKEQLTKLSQHIY